jgi:hypothetical protein
MKSQIFYNSQIENYTLKSEIEKVKSIKKIPIKYKQNDSTSKFREEILNKEITQK